MKAGLIIKLQPVTEILEKKKRIEGSGERREADAEWRDWKVHSLTEARSTVQIKNTRFIDSGG